LILEIYQEEVFMMPAVSSLTPSNSAPLSPVSITPFGTMRKPLRVALIATTDSSQRERLRKCLSGLRWQVLEAHGGADAWAAAQGSGQLEALLIDPWLPDLDIAEFLTDFHRENPTVSLMLTDGTAVKDSPKSAYHQELLYALRNSQEVDSASWNVTSLIERDSDPCRLAPPSALKQDSTPNRGEGTRREATLDMLETQGALSPAEPREFLSGSAPLRTRPNVERIPELVGTAPSMLEVSRRIRLVAARMTPVLIEGPTGSGKELVAEALHRLSNRSRKPLVAINCAAIPEALLEAELFGHTRGAFTGAVQGRTGRIESADGGTLFLDEIGEMPLALQSKLLRFVESGELQRIGDNETVKVDVRIVAATHQPLAEHAQNGNFRSDLYYRLAVFLIRTPALSEHLEDLPQLVEHFLAKMGRTSPVKRLDPAAMVKLRGHDWPGNVRELEHVLERAAILAGDEPVLTEYEIDFGIVPRN
jgi:DNA-binding NtrC family response regulator